jgi:hypothetical protein
MTKIRKFLLALLIAAGAAGATAAPALADGRDWHRDRDWHAYHRPVVYPTAPVVVPYGYGYLAPPVAYAAPIPVAPPVVYTLPSLSFNLSLPIR